MILNPRKEVLEKANISFDEKELINVDLVEEKYSLLRRHCIEEFKTNQFINEIGFLVARSANHYHEEQFVRSFMKRHSDQLNQLAKIKQAFSIGIKEIVLYPNEGKSHKINNKEAIDYLTNLIISKEEKEYLQLKNEVGIKFHKMYEVDRIEFSTNRNKFAYAIEFTTFFLSLKGNDWSKDHIHRMVHDLLVISGWLSKTNSPEATMKKLLGLYSKRKIDFDEAKYKKYKELSFDHTISL
jgi:hypothetical protein